MARFRVGLLLFLGCAVSLAAEPHGATRLAPPLEVPGPLAQAELDEKLLFLAKAADGTTPLFVSDGTQEGTRILLDSITSKIPGFYPWKGELLFTSDAGHDNAAFYTLWRTHGTAAGPRVVAPVVSGFWSPMPLGDSLLFASAYRIDFGGPHDVELWRTDGRHGVVWVADINQRLVDGQHGCYFTGSSWPGPGVALAGGPLVFAADDGRHGRELWATDGTTAGTRPVRDIHLGRVPREPDRCDHKPDVGLSSDPRDFIAWAGGALFTADDGRSGRELWWTDGTFLGTRRIKDIRPGRAGSAPHDLLSLHGFVYFFAASGPAGTGESLWRTDGTAHGTTLVSALGLGDLPSWGSRLTVVRNRLFFVTDNEMTGAELWTSGGDAASTGLVVDLRPGPAGSSPQDLTAVGNVLVFAADDGEHGLEAWRSDGTVAGTRILDDFNPGPDAGAPGPFTRAGAFVFTGASDGTHERGLWPIPLSDVLRP